MTDTVRWHLSMNMDFNWSIQVARIDDAPFGLIKDTVNLEIHESTVNDSF